MRVWSHSVCVVLMLGLLSAVTSVAQAGVLHTFDTSAQIAGYGKAPGSDPASTITWLATGGNPDGFLRYNEATTGGEDRMALPGAFLGDKSGYFGGELSFDHRLSGGSSYANTRLNDVEFVGGGLILQYDLPTPGLNAWVSHVIPLDASGAWINSATGLAATPSEILSALGDLTAIYLHVDFRLGGVERSDFDNIRMVPEPASVSLALLGAIMLLLSWRRRTA